MHMVLSVAIAGASGYVGGELCRLLLNHPDCNITTLTAGANAGELMASVHPHVPSLGHMVLRETSAETLAGHDVVFLALPHGASAELAAALPESTLVIDCGADHRLVNPGAWESYYGSAHAGSWPYGLPELADQRAQLSHTKRIAVPGCFPTVASLALAPAVEFIGEDIVIVAATGTSGAGKALKPNLLASEIMGGASAYGVGGTHRHIPEIEQNLMLAGMTHPRVSFTPILAPMSRGILATCIADLTQSLSAAEVMNRYQQHYASEPFVEVLSEGQWPSSAATLGSNAVHLQVTVDDHSHKLIAVGAIDNLTKGTAGAAIQSMNLALSLNETTGLTTAGVAP